jgi:hypothetical protein
MQCAALGAFEAPPPMAAQRKERKQMNPVKISVFAVPFHVVFRPSGRPIRIRNEGRSLAESQREWLQHRLHQASRVEPVQSAMSAGKPDYDK